MTVILALVLIMLVIWRKCITRCVAIIRESTKVFKVIPSMMIWPLISIVFLTAVYIWAFAVAGYIFYTDETTYSEYADKLAKSIEEARAANSGSGESIAASEAADPSTQKW